MKYFTQLDLPTYENLFDCLKDLEQSNVITWKLEPDTNNPVERDQLCINTVEGFEEDYTYGCGSLTHDWLRATKDENGNLHVPERPVPLNESDFTVMCSQFKNTLIEEFYKTLTANYNVGRVRIMRSKPKTCLTWHQDTSLRIHYPLKTQPGCIMVIDDTVHHMPTNTWWLTDTTVPHTAFNGSKSDRYHIVAVVLD